MFLQPSSFSDVTGDFVVIVLQMFIAVINENFDIAEESKRSRQASHYWASHRPQKARAAWIRRLNPYRWLKAQPKAIAVEQLPSNLVLPMQKSLIQDNSLPRRERSRVHIFLFHMKTQLHELISICF